MRVDVVLATCAELPHGDPDDSMIVAALAEHQVHAVWSDWAAPLPASDALVVLRSTWDYVGRREQFLDWTESIARLANHAALVRWNTDKVYLREVEQAGIAVTPTRWVEPGQEADLDFDTDFVVKPSVGAGSRFAGRFASHEQDRARAHLETLHASGATAMVQPYLDGVDDTGEAALIYFDGLFSHAITKHAMLAPGMVYEDLPDRLFVTERIEARVASAAERAVGDKVAGYISDRFGTPLYLRVDLLPAPSGPVVIEVEVTEPSLFLGYSAGAVDRFAAAIAGRA